jgi:endo-1,4-beta-xylanase
MRVTTAVAVGVMCGLVGMAAGVAQQAAGPVPSNAAAALVNPHAAVALWANGAPGSEGKTAPEAVTVNADGEHSVTTVNNPSIAPYLVRGARTPVAAVIVMPGGGHYMLSIDHEGYDVAKYLSGHGVAAFVLKYRLAREKGSTYTVEGNELDDVQRAIRLVRARAAEWNVDPARWRCWRRRGGTRRERRRARRKVRGTRLTS